MQGSDYASVETILQVDTHHHSDAKKCDQFGQYLFLFWWQLRVNTNITYKGSSAVGSTFIDLHSLIFATDFL